MQNENTIVRTKFKTVIITSLLIFAILHDFSTIQTLMSVSGHGRIEMFEAPYVL